MKKASLQSFVFLIILFFISCKEVKQTDNSNYLVDGNKITNIKGKKTLFIAGTLRHHSFRNK